MNEKEAKSVQAVLDKEITGYLYSNIKNLQITTVWQT